MIIVGDCVEEMARMDAESVDAIVTDPPYGLEFMGKEWDRLDVRQPDDPTFHRSGVGPFDRAKVRHASATSYGGAVGAAMQAWHQAWAAEALRVLKPGGHVLAFGGTRTYHRLACGLEDAGFEIRDSLMWIHGQGFPKALDVSKAIDDRLGAERKVVGERTVPDASVTRPHFAGIANDGDGTPSRTVDVTEPATEEARRWHGWATALKPAFEPIVLARKPLAGSVAENVLEHGTGALNIGGCKIGDTVETWPASRRYGGGPAPIQARGYDGGETQPTGPTPGGRWPANVTLSHLPDCKGVGATHTDVLCAPGCPVAELNREAGDLSPGRFPGGGESRPYDGVGRTGFGDRVRPERTLDSGGAARFFYVAKASRAERNAGLEGWDEALPDGRAEGEGFLVPGSHSKPRANAHPTVKPVTLMRWLIRLVTPPGGLVLDPFLGSGTTGCAAALEGVRFVGVEREPEYAEIAKARIAHWERWGEHTLTSGRIAERAAASDRELLGEEE